MQNTHINVDRKIEVADVTVGDVVECTTSKGTFKAKIDIIYDLSAVVEIGKREKTVVQFKNMSKDGKKIKIYKKLLKRTHTKPNQTANHHSISKEKVKIISKRRVEQWTMDGTYIGSFESITAANNHFDKPKSGIGHCLRKLSNSSMGYRWKYSGEEFTKIEPIKRDNAHMRKSVLQIKNGLVINEYASIREAAKALGINPSTITAAAKKKQKTSGGFEWEYKANMNWKN
ncbi:NUMOD1 domain-containing DNA-binding protein [Carnobacterium sp. ISL-102]|uniref:NUMOD1 domain-containing DNA-binding protein n=1 Tax=Carnobacterium sp. ISL-102 TaxID=2819142 RepID=UPI001BEADFA1|nr:NUMOD1 domain-containing DNA-binding protein [Carnobacterium sp. ISL-102]MBT2732095.1 hypothetical protein [Carnobacterium sp. ISL-102]